MVRRPNPSPQWLGSGCTVSTLGKVRRALTRNGVDSAAKILLQLAIVATAEVVFIALLLIIGRAVL